MPRQERDEWDIASSVGLTALAVAGGRAIESKRAEPLVVDDYADTLVRSAGAEVPTPTRLPHPGYEDDAEFEQMWSHMATSIGIRSRFFDEYFAEAWQADITQAVILASGLDSRGWRLRWPHGAVVFEIDQPRVLAYKDDLLLNREAAQPRCERISVPIDLRDDWSSALRNAGFDSTRRTAWLAEGLLPYLPDDAEAELLRCIGALSAPGSMLAVEHAHALPQLKDADPVSARMRRFADRFGIDFTDLVYSTDDRPAPDATLREMGWQTSVTTGAELATSYGRSIEGSPAAAMGRIRYVTAHKPR